MGLKVAKSRREVVDPNEGFLQKLREFEAQMKKPRQIAMICQSAKLPLCKSHFSSSSSEDLMEKQRSVDV